MYLPRNDSQSITSSVHYAPVLRALAALAMPYRAWDSPPTVGVMAVVVSDVSPPSEDEPRNEEEMFCQTYGGESNIKPPPLGNVTQVKYLSKVCGSLLLENAQR